jgi:radical SAM protein with 4Fe4S-binding SPASM domain
LNPGLPDWIVTNSNGSGLLKLCDGKRTVREIALIVSRIAGADCTDEAANFFRTVIAETRIFSTPAPIALHPYDLSCVHLNLTNKCNLACIYCYADERDNSGESLRPKDYYSLIDSISSLSRRCEIVITGGEPLLNDHVLDVASYAKNRGNQVHLLTNGTLIEKERARALAELFDLIKVSVDGSEPETHDYHRGKGSFKRTMEAVDLLIRNNARMQVAMTVTKRNVHDIGAMSNRFGNILTFAPLFRAGRARKNKQLTLTGREYYKALSAAPGVNPMSCLDSSFRNAKRQRITKCLIGDGSLSISDKGEVYPCHLLHLPQFLAGNIKSQSLESIYQSSDKLRACKELNVTNIKGCTKCAVRFICGGACRARAFYERGRIDVSDRFCIYEKLAFTNGLFDAHEMA